MRTITVGILATDDKHAALKFADRYAGAVARFGERQKDYLPFWLVGNPTEFRVSLDQRTHDYYVWVP